VLTQATKQFALVLSRYNQIRFPLGQRRAVLPLRTEEWRFESIHRSHRRLFMGGK
jgi:hypothetical protein